MATWVRPVIDELNRINKSLCDKEILDYTLGLVLVPCPNATGKEFTVANSWNKFELITKSKVFGNYYQRRVLCELAKKGIVIFLGGDQFWVFY